MQKIRVLIVEDSLTVRQRLAEAMSADPGIEVAGTAGDGKTAIELCRNLRPDVMTVDMVLPDISGLAVTEYVMAYCPVPILIVSSSTNRGDVYKTYDALAAGAVDVLEKPDGTEAPEVWEGLLRSTIKLVSRIKVITHIRGRRPNRPVMPAMRPAPGGASLYRVIAVGASTGGPAALMTILRALPADFPLPILVVNHIGEKFGPLLSGWLHSQSALRVDCAVDGEPLGEPGEGRVILAPPGSHLVLEKRRLRLTGAAERHSCRPSVDVLFESVARECGDRSIACLLTGMGCDGAAGLLAVRHAGGRTLAQNRETSTIFGMPQEAIRMGAAERVAGLHEIAPALIALAGDAPDTQAAESVAR